MSAAKLDIVLEEHSNFTKDFTYLDEDGNEVDVTGYGGLILFGTEDKLFTSGDHNDGWIQMGGTNGQVIVNVPYTAYQNLHTKEGIWQLYIHPTANDITDRPKRFIEGNWVYSKTLIR